MAVSVKEKKINKGKSEQDQKEIMKNIMETMLLDMTLTKVGGLLALGFGEAGSEIIA